MLMRFSSCVGPDGHLPTKVNQIDLCHISVSYVSFVLIWHLMSYDAYDKEISYQSIWLILVSKRLSGPQQFHPFIQFWARNFFKFKKYEKAWNFWPIINFENPLSFWPNFKSIFAYLNWLEIKKLLCKMFLKSHRALVNSNV